MEARALLKIEAEFLGVSPECLISIRYGDQWGERVKRFDEDYHATRKETRKPANRLRGNKYRKFYDH